MTYSLDQLPKIEHGKWYVAEVSFRAENPIHRAVCYARNRGYVELFGSYDEIIATPVNKLSFFRVICEIPAMTERFENEFRLPHQATVAA